MTADCNGYLGRRSVNAVTLNILQCLYDSVTRPCDIPIVVNNQTSLTRDLLEMLETHRPSDINANAPNLPKLIVMDDILISDLHPRPISVQTPIPCCLFRVYPNLYDAPSKASTHRPSFRVDFNAGVNKKKSTQVLNLEAKKTNFLRNCKILEFSTN